MALYSVHICSAAIFNRSQLIPSFVFTGFRLIDGFSNDAHTHILTSQHTINDMFAVQINRKLKKR